MVKKILDQLPITDLTEHPKKFKFNCFLCDDTQKKANLYKDSNKYHCFNCDTHKNIIEIAEEYHLAIPKKDYEELVLNLNRRHLFRISKSTIDYLKSKGIKRDVFKKAYKLEEVFDNNRALRFIKSNILGFKINSFLYDDIKKHIYLLNMNDAIIVGYCILNLKNFGKPEQFRSLNYIYDKLGSDYFVDLSIDIISTHFNILSLDLNKPIIIFDDVVNSLFNDNSLHVLNNYHLYDYYKPLYFFANNLHGDLKVAEKKSLGYSTFNWFNFLKVNKINNKIYDLHDLKKYEKKINKKYSLINFFN